MTAKICIAGKNNIAVNAILFLLNDLKISKDAITVVTNKTDNAEDGWQKSLKKIALDLNIKISSLDEIYNIDDILFLSLEFDRIIKTEKFKTDRLFNIHFSNLPKYKGMFTSVVPILNGEKEAGVTLHKIDNGIDTGDIIDQIIFPLEINDTARDLYFKYLDNAFILFKNNIKKLIENKYSLTKQNVTDSCYYSKNDLNFSNININLKKTSFEIHNQLRAFIFKEYQLPKLNNVRVKSTILTDEFIGYNIFREEKTQFVLSGIDGYKLFALKDIDK